MPSFNTTDDPIGQDGYSLAAVDSATPRPDASVVGYEPALPTDWSGGADPGNVDAGLDQAASRISANEAALAGLTSDHGGLSGLADDDHTQYLLADGTRDLSGNQRVAADGRLELRSASQSIRSSDSGVLDLDASGALNLRVGGAVEAVLSANTLTFQNGAVNAALVWPVSGQLGIRIGVTTIGVFKVAPEVELDVSGIVRGSAVRADAASADGASNTTTMTAGKFTPSPTGAKAGLDRLPDSFTTSNNAGWMAFKIGTTTAIVPYWT